MGEGAEAAAPKKKVSYKTGFFTGNNKPAATGPVAEKGAHVDSVCGVCGAAESYSRCGRCQKVTYCGGECQEYDWWRHKKTCVPWDYHPVPALEQSTICPYCMREVKMKDLALHMDSDCGKHLDVMLGRKPMPPLDGEADDDDDEQPEVEWVPSPNDPKTNLVKGGQTQASLDRPRTSPSGGPVAPPRRDRRRERFKKDLNPVYPGLEGKTQKPLAEREEPADAAAGRANPFWDFVDEYPTTARGAMLMGWARHAHRARKDEDLIDRPNRGVNATEERKEAGKRHKNRVTSNKQMVEKILSRASFGNIWELGEICDEVNYWFTPREARHFASAIDQARAKLAAMEKATERYATASMWASYAALRKTQTRILNAYREGDRELTGKLRPGMEKALKATKEIFETTHVGQMGRVAG